MKIFFKILVTFFIIGGFTLVNGLLVQVHGHAKASLLITLGLWLQAFTFVGFIGYLVLRYKRENT